MTDQIMQIPEETNIDNESIVDICIPQIVIKGRDK